MSSFLVFCYLLTVTGSLTLALEHPPAEKALYDLFGGYDQRDHRGYDSHSESLVYEHKYDNVKKSFIWRDCGGRASVVHLKSFSISPLPLRLPGNVIIALNATVDSDIEPPISVDMEVMMNNGSSWVRVCDRVPGGCHRENICSTQAKQAAAAAEEKEEEGKEGEKDTNPVCEMKKGDFSLPPTSFPFTDKAPSGRYRLLAKFRKETKRIGCIYLHLDIE